MNRQLVIAQRAFITVDNFVAKGGVDENGELAFWRFGAQLANHGALAVQNALIATFWDAFPGDLPNYFDFPAFDQGMDRPLPMRFSLGPGNSVTSVPASIKIEKLEEFGRKKTHLFVWGWVEYNDGFEDTPRRRTEFAFEVIVRLDPKVNDPDHFGMPRHRYHNGYDEGCFRFPATFEDGEAGRLGPIRPEFQAIIAKAVAEETSLPYRSTNQSHSN